MSLPVGVRVLGASRNGTYRSSLTDMTDVPELSAAAMFVDGPEWEVPSPSSTKIMPPPPRPTLLETVMAPLGVQEAGPRETFSTSARGAGEGQERS